MAIDGPLSTANLGELRRAAAACSDCQIRVERAQSADIEVDEQAARAEHLRQAIQKMIDVYSKPARTVNG